MPKRTAEELIAKFSSIVGDRTDDDVVSMMEDIKDSYAEPDPFEPKYNDLLKRYRDRFEASEDVEETNEVPDQGIAHEDIVDEVRDVTFDDLMIDE